VWDPTANGKHCQRSSTRSSDPKWPSWPSSLQTLAFESRASLFEIFRWCVFVSSSIFPKKIYHSSLKLPLTLSYDHKHSTIILLGGPQGPRLELKGTVSYTLAGNSYNAPVRLVLPHNFPMASPYVFLDPAAGMVVNPSYLNRPPPRLPRVDPNYQNLLYSDYTSSWRPGDCSLLMLLAALVSTFSTETPMQAQSRPPPVVSPGMDVVQPPPQGESLCTCVCVRACVRCSCCLLAFLSFRTRARAVLISLFLFSSAPLFVRARVGNDFLQTPKSPFWRTSQRHSEKL